MVFLRRPFLVVLIGFVVFICIWYHMEGADGSAPTGAVPIECVGSVDEIQVGKSGTVLVLSDVEVVNTSSEQKISVEKFLIYDCSEQNLFLFSRPGNRLRIRGSLSLFEKAGNPGAFDEFSYYACKGITGRVFAESATVLDARFDSFKYFLYVIRKQAVEQLFTVMDEGDAGILSAMLFGDRAYLPEEQKELYQRTGIGHMLVISGLHISLLGAGLFFLLRSYVMPMRQAAAVTMVFLFVYGQFTGFQVATVRAVLMMCCSLFARYTGRTYDPLSALSLSAILSLVQEPLLLFQCGFLLSYAAVFGILLFAPVMETVSVKSGVLQSLLSSAAVTAVTLPVMLWFYYEICPYSIFANMLVLPFLSLLVGIGLAGCVLSFLSPAAGGFLLAAAHYILKFYEAVCRFVEGLPMSRIVTGRPTVCFMVLYYIILVVTVWVFLKWEKKQYMLAGLAALCAASLLMRRDCRFLYTQLDVGQGDCACIFYGDKTYLIDGGSSSEQEIGKYVIQKFLKYYGRDHVERVFLTHSDADHTNGIEELAASQSKWGIRIGGIIMPEIQRKDERYLALLRTFQECNLSISSMKKGDRFTSGELSVTCLHPFPDYEWKNENDYSLTLDISYRNVRILTTGDLEESGENEIERVRGNYDILKVGHHGSKTSSTEAFLDWASPKHALISAGKNNRYGHPAPVTLEKLRSRGVRIWNTIDQGAIFLKWDKGVKKLESYRKKTDTYDTKKGAG